MEKQPKPQRIGIFIKWLSRTIVVVYGVIEVVEQSWDTICQILNIC